MAFPKVKSNNYKLLIFLILTTLSSCNITQDLYLQNIENNVSNNNSNVTSNETDTSSFTEDPGTYLLGWFVIFFFMGLYIVCSMKKYPDIANRTDDVWKFMFFANNGILVAASVNVFNIKNLIIDSSPFALSSIVFIIGCIYYIYKFSRTCSMQIANQYFECVQLGELYKLPCFIWSLVGLTDPCCRSNTYTVTYYSDGHTESDYCCHLIWNCVIYVIKRFAVIFTFMSYYIFLLFYLFFWLIAKSIFMLIFEQKENPPSPNQEDKNNNNDNNDNNNNDNNNGSKEIIINNGPPIFVINNNNNIIVNKTQNSYENKDHNRQNMDLNKPRSVNNRHFQNSGPERMKSEGNLFNNRENNETKKSDDNSKNNDDTNKKDDLPSEGEIYEKTPNVNSQNYEIRNNEHNGYINNDDSNNIDKNNYSNDRKNNNMKDAPAPEYN